MMNDLVSSSFSSPTSKRNDQPWIQNLPDSLFLEVLYWVNHMDQEQFSKVNKSFASNILKAIRRLTLRYTDTDEVANLFLNPQSSLLRLIVNPEKQLRLIHPYKKAITPIQAGLGIRCDQLRIPNVREFRTIMKSFNRIHRVEFIDGHSEDPPLTDDSLLNFVKLVNQNTLSASSATSSSLSSNDETQFQLKELLFINNNFLKLPVITYLESLSICYCPDLEIEGLNIPHYSHLRYLKLDECRSITDVSCLDHIHELHLISCDGFSDISCLNHNYKIVINNCWNVSDYSNSFLYSTIIHVNATGASITPIKTGSLKKAKELKLSACFEIASYPDEEEIIIPSNLEELHITDCGAYFQLSKRHDHHQLNQLTLTKTIGFHSFINTENIYHIRLDKCRIASLEGFNPKNNRSIEIIECHSITDWSPLSNSKRVVIDKCQGFSRTSEIQNIQESFTLTPYDFMEMPNLQGVTHLKLEGYLHFPMAFLILKRQCLESIQVITMTITYMTCFQELKQFFIENQSLRKIIINYKYINNFDYWFNKLNENLKDDVCIEQVRTVKEIVLLKKLTS